MRGIGVGARRVCVLVLLAAVGASVVPSARAATPALSFVDSSGIHVEAVEQPNPADARLYNVKVSTPALGRTVDVRVLVPDDYSTTPTRLPVLYLFHGTSGRASDWTTSGAAEQATAGLQLIVVMPDAGFDGNGGGWFTNWVDTSTVLGPSQWETFHVDQLIPWIDANLRTIATRAGRAVAGLSQGGFGSTTYPARHPDRFVSAASFSGAPDIDYNPLVAAGASAVIEATAYSLDGVEPDAMFGPRSTDEINWQGHDPATLVTNLRGVDVWLYTATGAPGPYDSQPNPGASGIEWLTHSSTLSFWQRAQQLGVPVHLEDYVLGTHTWAYWARDLREYLVPLMQTFAAPPAPPSLVSYQSIDQNWTQWGWTVALDRSVARQFSFLTDAGCNGFSLRGTGTATVTTPVCYVPGSLATVTMDGASGPATVTVVADPEGRLRLTVPLDQNPVAEHGGGVAVVGVPDVPPTGSTTTVVITAR